MSYNKQMAKENKAMFERALKAIDEVGWSYRAEVEAYIYDPNFRNPYFVEKLNEAAEIVGREFPCVPAKRMKSQVAKAFARKRGEATRQARKRYKTDSGLGGSFTVKIVGVDPADPNRFNVQVIDEGWIGYEFWRTADQLEEIKEK